MLTKTIAAKTSFDDANDFPKKDFIVRPMNGGDDLSLIGILQCYGSIRGGKPFVDLKNLINTNIKNIHVAIKAGQKHPCAFSWQDQMSGSIIVFRQQNLRDIGDVSTLGSIDALIRGSALRSLAKFGYNHFVSVSIPDYDETGCSALRKIDHIPSCDAKPNPFLDSKEFSTYTIWDPVATSKAMLAPKPL